MRPESSTKAWAVYALTQKGAGLATKVAAGLQNQGGAGLFLPERLRATFAADGYFQSSKEALSKNFNVYRGHLMVGAVGLTVRHIAPLLKSKKEDPAVVVLSQDGRWAISLLSGHLGGGNELTRQAAGIIGAEAVITTATDVENLPAIEVLACEANLRIEDFKKLPAVSRCLVEGEKLPFYDPEALLLPFVEQWINHFEVIDEAKKWDIGGPQIRVDYHLESKNFPEALIMRPRALVLGLGCHQGLPPEEMACFVTLKLKEAGFSDKSVAALATVEIRRDEPAMLELSRKLNCSLIIFTKEELEKIITPNPSKTVLRRIGVPSVCEAAALLATGADQLLLNKQKGNGVTMAVAVLKKQIKPPDFCQ